MGSLKHIRLRCLKQFWLTVCCALIFSTQALAAEHGAHLDCNEPGEAVCTVCLQAADTDDFCEVTPARNSDTATTTLTPQVSINDVLDASATTSIRGPPETA